MPTVDAPVCVFCRRQPMNQEYRPFCSDRCRVQDLARWADGAYRVAAESVSDTEDTEENDKSQR